MWSPKWPVIRGDQPRPSTRHVVQHAVTERKVAYTLHTARKKPGTFDLQGRPRPGVVCHRIWPNRPESWLQAFNVAVVARNGAFISLTLPRDAREQVQGNLRRALELVRDLGSRQPLDPQVGDLLVEWLVSGCPDHLWDSA